MLDKIDLQLLGKMEDECVDLVEDELLEKYKGMKTTEAVEIAKLAELKLITDALEHIAFSLDEINDSLSSIDQTFGDCISKTERGSLICITGYISTREM